MKDNTIQKVDFDMTQDKPKQGQQHQSYVQKTQRRSRTSYVSPSREGTVTIAAHVDPELKNALKKKFEQSGFEHFNDFLTAGLQRLTQEPLTELKPSTELAEAALLQSRDLQKTISLLTQDLSRHTR